MKTFFKKYRVFSYFKRIEVMYIVILSFILAWLILYGITIKVSKIDWSLIIMTWGAILGIFLVVWRAVLWKQAIQAIMSIQTNRPKLLIEQNKLLAQSIQILESIVDSNDNIQQHED